MNTRHLLLIALTLLAVALALFLPAVPQPMAHHDFADMREAYGIENFLDLSSNLAFALAGATGLLLVLRPRTCFASPAERWPYLVFCIGVLLTAAGSCCYHLKPNNDTLFWDRLAMTIAFMSLISAQIVDRVDVRAGLWALAPMHPSRYTHGRAPCAVFFAYLLAKVFEYHDWQIFELTGTVSGHTPVATAVGCSAWLASYQTEPSSMSAWRWRIRSRPGRRWVMGRPPARQRDRSVTAPPSALVVVHRTRVLFHVTVACLGRVDWAMRNPSIQLHSIDGRLGRPLPAISTSAARSRSSAPARAPGPACGCPAPAAAGSAS